MPSMIRYDDLLREAKGIAPLIPDNDFRFEFRRAFQEFCRVSKAWRTWVEIPEVAEQQTYSINPPYAADVIDVLALRTKAADSTNDFDWGTPRNPTTWRFNRNSVNPQIVLSWTPQGNSERITRLLVVMQPKPEALEVDDVDFFQRWHRAVLAKALYELLIRPGPWQNVPEAQSRRNEYWNVVGDAKRDAELSNYESNGNGGLTG